MKSAEGKQLIIVIPLNLSTAWPKLKDASEQTENKIPQITLDYHLPIFFSHSLTLVLISSNNIR